MYTKAEYDLYLTTEIWYSLRESTLMRDGYRCRLCERKATEVHHRRYPEILGTETIDDLTSLCSVCHRNFHYPPSIQEVKDDLYQKALQGTTCPLCDRYFQQYERSLYNSMAKGLLWTYAYSRKNKLEWVHYQSAAPQDICRGGDYAKLRHWDLIQSRQVTSGKKKNSSGYWKVTPKGSDFCLGLIKVPKKAILLNDEVQGFTGKEISIQEALDDQFDYETLLNLI